MLFVLLSVSISLLGCSAGDDPDSPGLCELKCSDAKIGPADARFRILSVSGIEQYSCGGVEYPAGANGAEYLGPVTVQYIAETPRRAFYRDPFDPEQRQQQKDVDDTQGKFWTPLSGLAFEPIILKGLMAGDRTSDENVTKGDNGEVSPYKYAGIVTPKSEWCTDSCGVASVEIWPICVRSSSNVVSLVFHSGPLYGDPVRLSFADESPTALTGQAKNENSESNSLNGSSPIDEESQEP